MGKKRHFSKNYPNKKEKAFKPIHSLNLAADEDNESWYDEHVQPDAATAFRLEYLESNYSSELDPSDFEECFPVMQVQEIPKPSNPEIS